MLTQEDYKTALFIFQDLNHIDDMIERVLSRVFVCIDVMAISICEDVEFYVECRVFERVDNRTRHHVMYGVQRQINR